MAQPTGADSSMKELSAVARANPALRTADPRFWVRHPLLLLALGVSGTAGWFLMPYMMGEGSTLTGWIISGLTLVATVYAALSAVFIAAELDVSRAMADYVRLAGERALRELRADQRQRMGLDDLQVEFLPQNATRTDVREMFERVVERAKDQQFGGEGALFDQYRERSTARVSKLDRWQQFALRMGILGTFIGLAQAMQAIPEGLASFRTIEAGAGQAARDAGKQAWASFMAVGEQLVSSLTDSFGTSIAGIACALVIWILSFIISRYHHRYLKALSHSIVVVSSLVKNAAFHDAIHEQFQKLVNKLDDVRRHLYDRMGDLAKGVGELEGRVAGQTAAIETGLDKLKASGKKLDGFLVSVETQQTDLIRRLDDLFAKASFPELFQEIRDGIMRASQGIGKTLDGNLKALGEQVSSIHGEVANVQRSLQEDTRGLLEGAGRLQMVLEGMCVRLEAIPVQLAETPRFAGVEAPSPLLAISSGSGVEPVVDELTARSSRKTLIAGSIGTLLGIFVMSIVQWMF